MPVGKEFKRKTQKLEPRDWNEISEMWLLYPGAANAPGLAPSEEIAEFLPLQGHLDVVNGKHPMTIDEDIPGLRLSVLKCGLFTLQKACYLLRAARSDVLTHTRWWSLSTAYHAAYFAAQAAVHLLGVTIAPRRQKGTTHIVDTFSERIMGQRSHDGPARAIRIIDAETSIDHKEMWAIYRRLLLKTHSYGSMLSKPLATCVTQTDDTSFGRQRHFIHYRVSAWPFDEFRQSPITDFGRFANRTTMMASISDIDCNDYSFGLANLTIGFACSLLADLARRSPLFGEELEIARLFLPSDCRIPQMEDK